MKKSVRVSLITSALLLSTFIAGGAFADEFKFKVHNNSGQAIKKLLVSEDGKTFGKFDIGSGIKAGATVELVWDQSTNSEACEQTFKVVFADGEESDAAEFNFCEDDLTLEFE
jgi:hypothetical protein